MRIKFAEWTKQHVDLYWEKLQEHKNLLELARGYGFFAEELNKRKDKKFEIEGVEIGGFRLKNYVGGDVYNINFLKEDMPDEMAGYKVKKGYTKEIYSIENHIRWLREGKY